MNQKQFEEEFSSLVGKVGNFGPRYKNNIMQDLSINQVDQLITDFSHLYIEGDSNQKKTIFDFFADKKILFDFWIYIRRAGMMIKSKDDTKWLQLGFAASLIDGARGEFKDLDVSLALLRYAAERVGIDARPYFDDAIQDASDSYKPYLVRNRDDDLRFAVQMFGTPEWAAESIEKYGEHPLYADLKKKKRKGFWGLFG